MGHSLQHKGHLADMHPGTSRSIQQAPRDFVLEKSIFSNVFEKDIRRVFIYKKSERLAKALHAVSPAFANSPSIRNKIDALSLALVEGAILPPTEARTALSRELLALSSILAIARTGNLLSPMNAELIAREAQTLLAEIAAYEEPRLVFDDAPTLSTVTRAAAQELGATRERRERLPAHIKDIKDIGAVNKDRIKDRRESVLAVLKSKGVVTIKDISLTIRGVSEKTIQRELAALIEEGVVAKEGERRWSRYSLTLSTP